MAQIVEILNEHVSSLQWIDQKVATVHASIQDLQRAVRQRTPMTEISRGLICNHTCSDHL